MVVEVSINDLLRCSDDEVANLGVELFERHVGLCSGLLQHAKGANNTQRHGVMADVKVEQ